MLSNTAVPIEYGAFRKSVIDGEIAVNQWVSMEMNRIDYLIERPEFYYDDQAIKGFINFCEAEMTLTDGGDLNLLPTFKLWAESALSWFYFSKEKKYDAKKKSWTWVTVKKRLINKQFLIVGRGAAKSLYAALIQAYFLNMDTSTTHQIVTAPTMALAEETISPIRTAIARAKGPLFKFLTEGNIQSNTYSKVKLASTKKGIQNFTTNSLIEVRPMSIAKLQGARSKYNTVDEWLSGDIKEDVIGAIEQGASKIDDYFILATSSEGTVRDKAGDTMKMELMDILRGTYMNLHVSIWYYKLDDIMEVGDPKMWVKANPNIGATVSYETYARDVERAEKNPATKNDILAKRFGIPVEGFSYFFTYEETMLHKTQTYDTMACSMGVDLSQGDDFCAFTFLFPLGSGRFGIKTRSYVSKVKVDKLPRAMYDRYQDFIKEGTLIVMDEPILDMNEVYEDIDAYIMAHQYQIMTVGYDPYNADGFLKPWTASYGNFGLEVVKQGVRTESVPMGELKIMAGERTLIFDEQLMKFAMGNAVALQDNNGNYKLSKLRNSEKIDNVAALLDAYIAYKRNREVFD